jgi:hypothetical protein
VISKVEGGVRVVDKECSRSRPGGDEAASVLGGLARKSSSAVVVKAADVDSVEEIHCDDSPIF